jgi:hypothetical protein
VGENLKYLLCTEQDRPVAAWLFGAAAWRCEARDRWIGWNDRERAAGLNRLTNNTRFLIPRWVRVRGLARWGWSRVRQRLVEDWRAKYGHGIEPGNNWPRRNAPEIPRRKPRKNSLKRMRTRPRINRPTRRKRRNAKLAPMAVEVFQRICRVDGLSTPSIPRRPSVRVARIIRP